MKKEVYFPACYRKKGHRKAGYPIMITGENVILWNQQGEFAVALKDIEYAPIYEDDHYTLCLDENARSYHSASAFLKFSSHPNSSSNKSIIGCVVLDELINSNWNCNYLLLHDDGPKEINLSGYKTRYEAMYELWENRLKIHITE